MSPHGLPNSNLIVHLYYIISISDYTPMIIVEYISLRIDRHGYPWVPTDQGPRCPCQVDPTCQKPCQLASGPVDLIHNPGDPGRPRTTLSISQTTCQACGASLSLDHGGGAASRPEDCGILSVITEGDLPKICNRPR
jgi:hypothetical protein